MGKEVYMKIVVDEVIVPEKQTLFKIKSDFKLIQPNSLRIAMNYRGFNQTKLCKNIKGLSQPNLSKFLKGDRNSLSEDKLKKIIDFLEFPIEFLYKEIKTPLWTSLNTRK